MMKLKKTLALLLAVVMVIGLIPFGAMAEETTPTETTAPIETTAPVETTTPVETDPVETDPTNPVTPQSDDPTNPVVTEPVVTEPVVTEPTVTEPVVTEPVVTEPVVTEPVVTEPVVTEPVVTEPVVTEPVVTEPVVTEPTETEPVETDPTDPTETEPEMTAEEVEALYNALMACASFDEVDALLGKMTESEYDAFLAALPDEQFDALDSHMREVFAVEPEGIVIPETAVNYSKAAPFGDPVEGKPVMRLMRMLSPRAAGDGDSTAKDNGLELRKNVSGTEKDGYTLTLEAWATGAKTITSSTTSVPTDIVLVLDQSGSMDYCMYSGCSDEYCDGKHEIYTATYDVSTSGVYYLYNSYSGYNRLYYCATDDGWYTNQNHLYHRYNVEYLPNTVPNGSETTFYVRSTETYAIRIDALKDALGIFTNNVATKAKGADGVLGTDDDVDHTVSVVGFGRANYSTAYLNTEILIGSNEYKYGTAARGQYANAPQDMSTDDGVNNVKASIAALEAEGGTYVDLGIEMANGILNANPVPENEKRNRVVIIFTDGAPGYDGSYGNGNYGNSGDAQKVADAAMTQIATTKNTHNATVYTVGIFAGADATSAGSNANGATNTQRANYFMQRLSSNTAYPQSPSYYLSASDSTTLNNIFEMISQNIESGGSTTTLTGDAVIKDVITDQFELPAGADADDIKVYTAEVSTIDSTTTPTAYTWKNRVEFTDADVSISTDRKTVSVDNFNYSENWVGTETKDNVVTPRGKKLIIEIPIVVREGFLGGNDVLTNGAGSGLYENADAEEPLEEFVSPTVDVQIKDVTVTAPDYNVYLLGGVDAATLESGLSVTSGKVTLDMDAENYGLAAWQNAYVTINDGDDLAALTNMTNDATYSATVTITPKTEGDATAKSDTGIGNVYVFKPVITWQDSEINAGETPDYEGTNPDVEDNFVSAVWMHGDTVAPAAMGVAPTLDYDYAPPEAPMNEDTPVDVTVKVGDTDITANVTFIHEFCDFENCGWTEADEGIPGAEFIVHIKSFDLIIKKDVVDGDAIDQSFLFKITCPDKTTMTIVINGEGQVKIADLPTGNYTVEEDTSWSWRYDVVGEASRTVTPANISNGVATVTFENDRTNDKWLDGSSYAKNSFTNQIPTVTN